MSNKKPHKKILVAPLNWGLGHASRCIPIIKSLLRYDFLPILASDGASLDLLRKEFPELTYYELPSSEVVYSSKGHLLRFKLLLQLPKFLNAVSEEKKCVELIHKKEDLSGIISDNRFGARCDEITSIYLTHQIQVLSGVTSALSSKWHQQIIAKFDQCWVPDFETNELAGSLSKKGSLQGTIKYIGPLSRFESKIKDKIWDIVAVLSGPEPQRQILEAKLRSVLKSYPGKCLLIQGLIEAKQKRKSEGNLTIVNFMLQQELGQAIEQGKVILSRSGYSSIMDLYTLGAKAFLIPTPGQFEQEYLAKHLKQNGYCDFSDQDSFYLEKLENIEKYQGFGHKKTSKCHLEKSLFDVFT